MSYINGGWSEEPEDDVIETKFHVEAQAQGVRATAVARLSWDSSDPLYVQVVFHDIGDEDTTVEWSISRDLLAEGVDAEKAVGRSDVHIRRSGGEVIVCLNAQGQHCDIICRRDPVLDFLALTEEEVPAGSAGESEIVALALEDFIESVYEEGECA